jgi:hypothetical protein
VPTPPLPERLDADAFYEAIGGAAKYDPLMEADYALCRLAWENCYADDPKKKPLWVLKGGFAIRHTYRSLRFSRDVDLAPVGMSTRGASDLVLTPELTEVPAKPSLSGKSQRRLFNFRNVVGSGQGRLWTDLNTKRPVRLPPPTIRTFESRYLPPFPVWVASIEEIIGEKSNGLLSFAHGDVDRIKDAFDLWFLLSNGHAKDIDKARLTKVLGQLRVNGDIPCPTQGLGVWFRSVLEREDAEVWWGRTVTPLLLKPGRVSLSTVREQLPALAQKVLV